MPVHVAEQRVLGWQTKLHRWAAQDEQQRFGDRFNLICDPATLLVAWERVKRNRGSRTAGVDGQTRKQVEQIGVEQVLDELRQELKSGCYRPLPSRERLIPKRSGKLRSLGVSTVRDRIVQTATKLVLEPIFEADFCPTSYGFRPGRRTQDAIEQVRFFIHIPRSYEWLIEGDVEDCFGQIHHGFVDGAGAPSGDRQARPGTDPAVPSRGSHARAWHPGRNTIGHATRVEYDCSHAMDNFRWSRRLGLGSSGGW
jgi:RNA-directed DNA polymerase